MMQRRAAGRPSVRQRIDDAIQYLGTVKLDFSVDPQQSDSVEMNRIMNDLLKEYFIPLSLYRDERDLIDQFIYYAEHAYQRAKSKEDFLALLAKARDYTLRPY